MAALVLSPRVVQTIRQTHGDQLFCHLFATAADSSTEVHNFELQELPHYGGLNGCQNEQAGN